MPSSFHIKRGTEQTPNSNEREASVRGSNTSLCLMNSWIPEPSGSEFFSYCYYEGIMVETFSFVCVLSRITNKTEFPFFFIVK